jgi:hypothetical protein
VPVAPLRADVDDFYDDFELDGVAATASNLETMRYLVDKHSPLAGTSLLYSSFRPAVWWWMLLVLVRRGLFTVFAVALANSIPGARFFAFTALNLAAALLQMWARPYTHDSWNRWEVATHTALLLIAATASAYPPPYSMVPQVIITLLVRTNTDSARLLKREASGWQLLPALSSSF